jgi:molecular chaperone DnaK
LTRDAEEAKRALSVRTQVTVTCEHGGEASRSVLTRAQFEELTADLLERTLFTSRNLLREAGRKWSDLTRMLLVGGSTRMPAVASRLEEESGLKVDRSLSPDEAVAHGAAVYAGILLNQHGRRPQSVKLKNVNSHSLGVRANDPQTNLPVNAVIIPKNTPLPAARTKRFKTAGANQSSLDIRVLEGGDASGMNSTQIGQCSLTGLPPGLPRGTPVDVTFEYAANGRVKIRATLPTTGHALTQTLKRDTGLAEADVSRWRTELQFRRGENP